jgi:hypothetical protein
MGGKLISCDSCVSWFKQQSIARLDFFRVRSNLAASTWFQLGYATEQRRNPRNSGHLPEAVTNDDGFPRADEINPHSGSSLMKIQTARFGVAAAIAGGLLLGVSAVADTPITGFNDLFSLDGLFAWSDATIVSTETNYSVTDIGYGSGYKDINPNIDASDEKTVEVTVRLSGPPGANGQLGPIVSLVDGDGTFYNYAWYGQTLGTHVLTANVNSPTFTSGAGSVPGLDLAALDFFHLQLDPGGFGSSGAYTVVWEDLRLTGATGPVITSQSFNPNTREFTLNWSSRPGKSYTILHTSNLSDAFTPLVTDIPSDGASTATTVTMPAGETGFLRIQEQ